MHPPCGMIELDFLRRALRLGGVLENRKTGRARARHPRQPGAVGGAERRRAPRRSPAECASPALRDRWNWQRAPRPSLRPRRPASGQAVAWITSVAPTSNSPLRRPSASNTSLVATGTRGLTSTQGMFGRLSGSRVSPTPVMSQAREARHTGTSAPVSSATSSRRASSSARPFNCASSRSAAAASAEPPPMPAATGNTLSSVKLPTFRSGTRSPSRLRRLEHEIVRRLAAGLRQRS